MALSDLELIQLADRASEGKRGERGPQGVSVRSIEQSGPESFTVNLSDGRSQEIRFPKPSDGIDGGQGPAGPKGDRGPAGRDGIQGEQGRPGQDGSNGADGSFVDSALVDQAGNLLVGLSDGQIITAGRVVGPVGMSGERGPVGLPGAAGRDGSAFLSGYQPPSDEDDGNDGDFWLDLSSPQFDLYGPKRSGAWGGRTTFLKQPPLQENRPMQSVPIGGGSGGGSGPDAQPAIRKALPPLVEVAIGTATGDSAMFYYRVTATADLTNWSAGSMNLAGEVALVGDEVFTIGHELTGTGGDLDLSWRVERNPGLDQLTLYATAPEAAILTARIASYTDA